MKKTLSRFMLSGSEASGVGHAIRLLSRMLRCRSA